MCDLNKPAEKGPQSNDNRIEDDSVNTVVAPSLDGSNTAPSGDEPAMKSSLNWIELSVIDLIKDVPLLGDVLIGYHAKRRMLDLGILEGSFMTVLMHPRQRDT
ncbi:MAG: hypothetical protein NTY66_03690, partial [Candidatus Vogelbacteria bacterium]|nr:hypothetical protein [Candidatus Vogelbacteria bacterium]